MRLKHRHGFKQLSSKVKAPRLGARLSVPPQTLFARVKILGTTSKKLHGWGNVAIANARCLSLIPVGRGMANASGLSH